MKLWIRNHYFNLPIPRKYFVDKFNFLIQSSNSFSGRIINNRFKGSGGPDFYPLSPGGIQNVSFNLFIDEEEKQTIIHGISNLHKGIMLFFGLGIIFLFIAPIIPPFKGDAFHESLGLGKIYGIFLVFASLLVIANFLLYKKTLKQLLDLIQEVNKAWNKLPKEKKATYY